MRAQPSTLTLDPHAVQGLVAHEGEGAAACGAGSSPPQGQGRGSMTEGRLGGCGIPRQGRGEQHPEHPVGQGTTAWRGGVGQHSQGTWGGSMHRKGGSLLGRDAVA